jgi:S-DNA-T family DNA segregation ATPase FtsK/SpoIIIE
MAFGTGGSGKTTFLRTVALGLARQGPPEAVRLYALDFASRALDPLADLPHCAAVVPGEDVERTTRLLTVLEEEIDRRRGVLAEARAESLGALRAQTGQLAFPRIVLLVDSYSGFHTTFDRADRYPWQQLFQRIVTNGRQVGVHFVLTTDRRMGVPNALLSAISARLALRMATPDELAALGVPTKLAKDADLPNGRGYLDGTIEVQVACVSPDPSGVAQSDAIAVAAEQLQAAGLTPAPRLPELPDSVRFDTPTKEPLTAPFGVVDLSLVVTDVDLSRQNLVVMGPPLSGKSTALETVAWGVRAATDPEIKLFALGSAASPLAGLDLWDDAAFSRAGHAGLLTRLTDLIGDDEGVEARALLFVDAAEDIEGNDVVRPLEALTKRDALRLAVACEASTLNKAYSGWLSPLRRNRSALLLQPESRADADAALGVKPSLRPDQPFPPGRGVFVANRRWSLVQVGLRPELAG